MLTQAFEKASQAAAPAVCLPPALEGLPRRPALVLGTGKAAASMAAAFYAHWGAPGARHGRHALRSRAQARASSAAASRSSKPGILRPIARASRPARGCSSSLRSSTHGETLLLPDLGRRLFARVAAACPRSRSTRKRAAANFLIRQGADIREINCVRKHLSRLKGGRLAVAAHPAPVATFVISDVPGDDVGAIASGPTVPDPTTQAEALRILEKYRYPGATRAWHRFWATRSGRRRSPAIRSSRATRCT